MSLSDVLFAAKPAYGTPPFAPAPWEANGGAQPPTTPDTLPAKSGFGGFMDRFLNPTNGLGQFGRALVMAGGSPIGDAYQLMDQSREHDQELQLKRAEYDAKVRQLNAPQIEHVGNQVGIIDRATGGFTPTYTAPETPDELTRLMLHGGIDPASPEGVKMYADAARNHTDPWVNFTSPDRGTYIGRQSGLPGALGIAPQSAAPVSASVSASPAPQPATGLLPAQVASMFGGAHMTSGYRTPQHNAAVGGVPNSMHTRGQGEAVDLVPGEGQTIGSLAQQARGMGRFSEVIPEGDHLHVGWGAKAGHATAGGTPTVSSASQYSALPSGATYVDARDGKTKVKS